MQRQHGVAPTVCGLLCMVVMSQLLGAAASHGDVVPSVKAEDPLLAASPRRAASAGGSNRLHILYPRNESVLGGRRFVFLFAMPGLGDYDSHRRLLIVDGARHTFDSVAQLDSLKEGAGAAGLVPWLSAANSSPQHLSSRSTSFVVVGKLAPGYHSVQMALQHPSTGHVWAESAPARVRVMDTSTTATVQHQWDAAEAAAVPTAGDHHRPCRGVFVYPFEEEVARGFIGPEYERVLRSVARSPHATVDHTSACALIPNVDTLCLHNMCRWPESVTSALLDRLPHWNGGRRHVVLHMGDHEIAANIALAAVAMSSIMVFERFPQGWEPPEGTKASAFASSNVKNVSTAFRQGLDLVFPLAFYSCHNPAFRHLQRFPRICFGPEDGRTNSSIVGPSTVSDTRSGTAVVVAGGQSWQADEVELSPSLSTHNLTTRPILLSFKGSRYGFLHLPYAPWYTREYLRATHNGADVVILTSCDWEAIDCISGSPRQFHGAMDTACPADNMLADLYDFERCVVPHVCRWALFVPSLSVPHAASVASRLSSLADCYSSPDSVRCVWGRAHIRTACA